MDFFRKFNLKNKDGISQCLYSINQLPEDNCILAFNTLLKNIKNDASLFKELLENMNKLDLILNLIQSPKYFNYLLLLCKYSINNNLLEYALQFANIAHNLDPSNELAIKYLIKINHRLGNINEKFYFLNKLKDLNNKHSIEYQRTKDEIDLSNNIWNWKSVLTINRSESVVLHVFNKYMPEINGYTIRSREIVLNQKKIGLNPIIVTKLGWPEKENIEYSFDKKYFDEIPCYHLYDLFHNAKLNKTPMISYLNSYAQNFSKLLVQLKPRIVHAASNFQNAVPALTVAKSMGINTIYEVRGMWHYSQSTKTPYFYNSDRFLLHQKYELKCCEIADKIVTICDSLYNHLVELGVDSNKITIIPNGVDTNKFKPIPKSKDIIKNYGLEGNIVIGFIGSLTHYEGLDYLLKAIKEVKKIIPNVKCLIVGKGPLFRKLEELTKQIGLENEVIFTGQIPYEEIQKFYSVIDIFPFPRIRSLVCELVTPLKPYEAMAMGKAVLVSDIPALREMVIDGTNGKIFEAEKVESLAECILNVIESEQNYGLKAREWVIKNRDWTKLVLKYNEVYDSFFTN